MKIPPKKRKTAYRSLRAICKKLGYTVMVGPMQLDTGRLPSELELRENSRNAKEQTAILRAYGLDKP